MAGIVTEVIRIFVDALPHVPDHRKLPLFSHLLRTVGSHDYLYVALGLMTEKQVVQGTVGDGKEQVGVESTRWCYTWGKEGEGAGRAMEEEDIGEGG